MGLLIIQPLVPPAHRKALVDAHLRFGLRPFVLEQPVAGVVGGGAKGHALEQQPASIRAPLRGTRSERDRRQTPRFPAREIEHIQLGRLVSFPSGAKGNLPSVR